MGEVSAPLAPDVREPSRGDPPMRHGWRVWRSSVRDHRVVLAAFLLAHVWLVVAGMRVAPGIGFYDLQWYWGWIHTGVTGGGWPVLDGPWVYPAAALAPMLVAGAGGLVAADGYVVAWCLMVTVLDLVACLLLLRRPGGVAGAWWWSAFLVLLGPVAVARLDAVVVPLVVVALLWAFDRPAVASVLLTAGAWIKVAPGALVVPLLAAVRRPWARVAAPAVALCAVVAGVVLAFGGGANLASFLSEQGHRGLQIEAVAGTPWVLAALVTDRSHPFPNSDINTWEIAGPGTQLVADLLGVVLPVALAAVAVLLWWRRTRLAPALWDRPALRSELLVRGALLATLTMVVLNKVGSPQFMCWLAAPVAVALALGLPGWRRTGAAVLGIAAATQVFFPWLYSGIPAGAVGTTLVLVARNVAVLALWVGTGRRLSVRESEVPPAPPPAALVPSAVDGRGQGR